MRKLDEIKLFMLDMDGTIYLGDRLFPCTLPFLERLGENGAEHLFLTNNSSRGKAAYLEKLERLGIPGGELRLMTSGDATIDYLQREYREKSVFLVGTGALADSFLASGIELRGYEDADMAVVGFDTELSYEKLNGLYQMVNRGKRYICTHPDLVCPTEKGFIPDIGATIAYIKALTGREPDLIIGKPERYMIEAAAKRFSVSVDDIAMVGDRLYTDIAMANRAGATSVLVLSGETKRSDLTASEIKPDYVFEDLAGLTELL
ncbi:MAG: HAD-IIA family hydrolase [Oscillospiraceae bacterium]|nr:HAD-IIA family hydrolase [Oscillospiraceae bacterium]